LLLPASDPLRSRLTLGWLLWLLWLPWLLWLRGRELLDEPLMPSP
jgi:hypothetical protein